MSRSKASYIKISADFGFNRHQLIRWRFAPERVFLYFADGVEELAGQDREAFRNWVEMVGEDAPMTHQYSMFVRNGNAG